MRFLPSVFRFINAVLIPALFTTLWAGFVPTSGAAADAPDVVILQSYHPTYPWTRRIDEGLASVFEQSDVETAVEYMDTKRIYSPAYLERLSDLYGFKYKERQPKTLVTADDNALRFALDYREKLFPGVPVVFCGVNNYSKEMLAGRAGVTGVVEDFDLRSTIDAALALHPDARRIVAVNDDTVSGRLIGARLARILPDYKDRAEFLFLQHLSVDEMAAALDALTPEDVVLYLTFQRDGNGVALDVDESMALMRKHCRRPIYNSWDHMLGKGVLGGMMVSGYHQGKTAAELALRVLNGESADAVPVIMNSPNRFMFDDRELKRFGISPSRLPKGSIVAFGPPSLSDRQKTALSWGLAGAGVLVIITAALTANMILRRRAEKQLAESEKKYRILADHATDMISKHAPGGVYTYASPACRRLIGYAPDELVGRSAYDFFHPEDVDAVNESARAIRAPGVIYTVAYRIRHKDGHYVWAETTVRAIHEQGTGEVQEIIAVTRDVSRRKQAEAELKETEERLQFVLEGGRLGFWDWDMQTNEVKRNRRWAEMLGYSLEEIEYSVRQWRDFIHPEDRNMAWQSVEDHLAGRTDMHKIEYRMLTKDGKFRWIFDQARVVKRDRDGTPLRMSGVHTDVTDRKQAEADRMQMEKRLQTLQRFESLGALAGGVAHDFNNILMAVLGNIDLARDELTPDAPAGKNLMEAENAARRARDLVRQMLAFSGKGHFLIAAADLKDMIQRMTDILRSAVSDDILLETRFSGDALVVEGDETQLRQVLLNLVVNAAESYDETERGSVVISAGAQTCDSLTRRIGETAYQVVISAGAQTCDAAYLKSTESEVWMGYDEPFRAGQYAFVEVTDQGCGMDAAVRSRLFEPFFSTKFQGRGLGLAAVMGIVRGHRGYIRIHSAPDRGTAFKVLFPTAGAAPAKEKEETGTVSGREKDGGLVLLTEDEEAVRDLVRKMLENAGYEVIAAADGPEALALYHQRGDSIDLILTDLSMPGMNGMEVLAELRRLGCDVPVILSSGYSEADIRESYAGKGFAGFIQKPYRKQRLIDLVHRVLG